MAKSKSSEDAKTFIHRFTGSLKLILIGLTATVALLVLIVLFLVSTENGTRWLVQTALSKQQQVKIAEIKGTLLNKLTLKQLQYQDDNHFKVTVSQLNFQWYAAELLQGRLHIARFQLDGISVNGQPVSAEDSESSAEIPKIPLAIIIDQLQINQFNWHKGDNKSDLAIHQLLLRAALEKQTLIVSELALAMPQLQVQAQTEIHLQSSWPLTADLDWAYHSNDTQLRGQLLISGDTKQFDLDSFVKGDVESTVNGFLKLSGEQPEFNLKGQVQKLQWPLQGVSQISSNKGDFHVQGSLNQYQANLNADVTAMNKSNYSISFIGNGNQESIDIKQLLLKPKQGQLKLDGHLSWSQGLDFNLALTANKLNPMDLGGKVPGKLELKFLCKGSIVGDNISAELTIEKLAGLIHDQPLNAYGNIKLANKQLTIQQLHVLAGSNQIIVKGLINEKQADLKLDIAADDLQTAWPTLAGSLNGNIWVKGVLNKPIISSQLQGQGIRYVDNQINKLSLNVNYFHASSQKSNVDFSASNIQLAGQKIDHILLHGQGNQNNHNANLALRSSLANLNINTNGQWNGKQWLGHITQLNVDHPQLKKWQLEYPTDISITKNQKNYQFELKNSCLIQGDARLCVLAQGSPEERVNGQLSVSELPLALTKQWLPKQLAITGTLSAQAELLSVNKQLTTEVNANIANGLAIVQINNDVNEEFQFTTSAIQLKYKNDQLNSHVHVELANQDFLTADISAGEADSSGVRKLSGSVQANIANMSLIDNLVTEISQLKGVFVADLQLKGNTQTPVLEGSAQWQNGELEIAKLGNTFQNINVKLNSSVDNPKRLLLNATIDSGEGKLSANGHLDLLAEYNYPFQLEIKGEKFLLGRIPEAEIIISPTLNINKKDEITNIDGLIKINSAKLKIKTVPENAIVPSGDEVIIGAKQTGQKKSKQSMLNAKVKIDFGEDAHFSGFGLETFLKGQLEYRVQKSKQSMHGRVEMHNASYRSYGQDLTIRKGEFLFNGPVDNPSVIVEAFRKAINEDVTAVLRVTGPVKSPETRVFTEPTLPESEALSYLVTGKSLKNISKGEGGSIASAAFNYGAGQLSWLSDQLGIDEFEYKEGENVEDSAVKLAHSLSPDLHIGVTMGLFASSYTANLRYQLNKYFSIGTSAGETQRIDLKYHLESD